MNTWIVLGIIAALFALRFLKLPILAWGFVWLAANYSLINYGIEVLVPSSVQQLYLSLTIFAFIVYLVADAEHSVTVRRQLTALMVEPKYKIPLYVLMLLIPAGVAGKIYADMTAEVRAPNFGRTVHPAPPTTMNFKGKSMNLITQKNPYRELEGSDPVKFKEHVENGRRVYYQNCVYCHGDDMGGDGIYAHALNPVPANFNSPTTIAMLQEGYLFWRIAKGGPGLPSESGPWSSSMPAWEKFLEEDEIWDVVLFLYDYTGYKPRAEEEGHH